MGFVKVVSEILDSSINDEDIETRWAWVALLVLCDRNGNIHGTAKALARRANMPVDAFRRALGVLTKPDPESTSSAEEGRRVIEVSQNEWHVVNYQHYKHLRDPDEVREQTRLRVAKHRSKQQGLLADGVTDVTPVTAGNDEKQEITPMQKQKQKQKQIKKERGRFRPPSMSDLKEYAAEKGWPDFDAEEFVDFYESKGWKVGEATMEDWKASARKSYRKGWTRRNGKSGPVTPSHQARSDDGSYPWHPEDVTKFKGLPIWDSYFNDCETAHGLQAAAWPRVEEWAALMAVPLPVDDSPAGEEATA